MTLPNEELYSLLETRKFLFALLDPKMTPKIPKYARERAGWLLKHYPFEYRIEDLYRKELNDSTPTREAEDLRDKTG